LVACVVGMPLMVTGVTTVQVRQVDDYERWELAGKPGNFNYNTGQQLAKQRPDVVTTLDRVLALFPGNQDVRERLAAAVLGAGAVLFGFWWASLGALAGSFPATVRAVFLPICNGFERKHGWRLAAVSLAVLFFWGVLAYEIAADAGLTGERFACRRSARSSGGGRQHHFPLFRCLNGGPWPFCLLLFPPL